MSESSFSMDGLRSSMIRESNDLKDSIDNILEDISTNDSKQIKESFNELARSIRFLLHTYNNETEDYSRMSECSDLVNLYED